MPEAHDLKPTCVQCSRTWRETHTDGLPGIVSVDRALIMRDAALGYVAVCHCHGATAIVALGTETPSDAKIRYAQAFGS